MIGKKVKRKIPIKSILYSSLFVILLVFILIIPTVIGNLLKIKDISCISQYDLCPSSLTEELETFKGMNLKSGIGKIKSILSEQIYIKDYAIRNDLVKGVEIEIVIEKPQYAISVGREKEYFLLSGSGKILEKTEKTNLPVVFIPMQEMVFGKAVDSKVLFVAAILDKVARLYTVTSGKLNAFSFEVVLPGGVTAIFPVEGDIDVLVGSLRLIFSRLNDESIGFKMNEVNYIDLRFKNPIIR